MLVIEVASIPAEGLDLDEALDAGDLHLGADEDFLLREGGRVRCRLERGDDGSVHLVGSYRTSLGLECHRCLEPFELEVANGLDLFYLAGGTAQGSDEEDVELGDRDLVVAYFTGDRLDLGEVLREQLLLALPLKRLCREGCEGRCASCGANRNLGSCACPPPVEELDPRLAALRGILDSSSN